MQKQKDMENTMLKAHRDFVAGLEEGINMLDKEIDEAGKVESVCTDEWCRAVEDYIDELHKSVYSISEPRWATDEDSRKIKELRQRIKQLYNEYKTTVK
jgi:hypothetical protein